MKTRHLIMFIAVALLVGACIPSVNPFYTAKDVVFESGLVGEWQVKEGADEPQLWKFEKDKSNSYKLTVTEKDGKQGQFSAHLFTLKGNYFLDLIPSDCNYATNQAGLVGIAMFPGHLLARVPQLGPELQIAFSNYDWIEKYLKANPKAIGHRVEDGGILLTADTSELQKFILKHMGTNELFTAPGELVRIPATH